MTRDITITIKNVPSHLLDSFWEGHIAIAANLGRVAKKVEDIVLDYDKIMDECPLCFPEIMAHATAGYAILNSRNPRTEN